MSYGVEIKNVFLERLRKDRLPNQVEEAQSLIAYHKSRLFLLAAASPHEVVNDDGEPMNWLDYVAAELAAHLDGLEEAIKDYVRASIAMDNFDNVVDAE